MIVHISLEAPFTSLVKRPRWDVEVAPNTTVAALQSIISQAEPVIQRMTLGRGGDWALGLAIGDSRLKPDHILKDGDRVQVFAPLLGG